MMSQLSELTGCLREDVQLALLRLQPQLQVSLNKAALQHDSAGAVSQGTGRVVWSARLQENLQLLRDVEALSVERLCALNSKAQRTTASVLDPVA